MKTTSPINLPGQIDCDSYLVRFEVDEIAPMSYRSYTIKKADGTHKDICGKYDAVQTTALENDLFRVTVSEMGEITVTDKKRGTTYADCIRLSDEGELGHSYVHYPVEDDVSIVTDNIKPEITVLSDTELVKSVSVKYTLDLPEELDIDTLRRSEKTVENTAEIKLSLIKGRPWIDIECTVDNRSKDHRLRMLFNTGMSTDYTTSLIPFDTIRRDRRDVLQGIANGTQPNSGLVYIGENNAGIGILNEGLYEYEHLLGDRGTVAVTLIRSVGMISNLNDRHQRNAMKNIDSQCIGTYTLHLGLTFGCGEESKQISDMVRIVKQFQNNIIAYFQPYSERKFTGGRPQVQDTDIAELFFREDKYKDIILDKRGSVFDICGDAMTVSAVKYSEDGKLMLIRAYNTSDYETDFAISLCIPAKKAYRLKMNEERIGVIGFNGVTEKIKVNPREVVTIGFELK